MSEPLVLGIDLGTTNSAAAYVSNGVPRTLLETGLPHPFESTSIQALGLVVTRYEPAYAHHAAVRSLADWLTASPEDADARLTRERLRRRIRLICAGCSEEQSRMTPVRRELPPSKDASRPGRSLGVA